MIEIQLHNEFTKWLKGVRDAQAKAAIRTRLNRFTLGLFGDVKPVGGGISEARINVGKGYRLYFINRGGDVVILLCGGIKSNKKAQQADIQKAAELAKLLKH